jgi:hypothetical protein
MLQEFDEIESQDQTVRIGHILHYWQKIHAKFVEDLQNIIEEYGSGLEIIVGTAASNAEDVKIFIREIE